MQDLIPFPEQDSGLYDGLHSVVIWFDYGLEDDELFYSLSLKLAELLTDNEAGVYDGHEIAMDHTDGSYYMFGPNAETLFKTVLPVLKQYAFTNGARADLCFGDFQAGDPMIEIEGSIPLTQLMGYS